MPEWGRQPLPGGGFVQVPPLASGPAVEQGLVTPQGEWTPAGQAAVAAAHLKAAAARQPVTTVSGEPQAVEVSPDISRTMQDGNAVYTGPGISATNFGGGLGGQEWLASSGGRNFQAGSYGPGGGQQFYPSSPEATLPTSQFGTQSGGLADMLANARSQGLYDELYPTPEFDLPEQNLRQATQKTQMAAQGRLATMLSPVAPGQEAKVPQYGMDVAAQRANPLYAYQKELDTLKAQADTEEQPIIAKFKSMAPQWDPVADPNGLTLPPQIRAEYAALMQQHAQIVQQRIQQLQGKYLLGVGSRVPSMEKQLGVNVGPQQEF